MDELKRRVEGARLASTEIEGDWANALDRMGDFDNNPAMREVVLREEARKMGKRHSLPYKRMLIELQQAYNHRSKF